jgi:hypothetical protein
MDQNGRAGIFEQLSDRHQRADEDREVSPEGAALENREGRDQLKNPEA